MWKLCVVLFLQCFGCSSSSTNTCVEVTLRNTPSESLTVSEGSTLDLTFTLNNVCPENDKVLSNYTIFIDKPAKDAQQIDRMCQFVHGNNGSCLLASPPQHCACGSSGLYTVTWTSLRSHDGLWKWSSKPKWITPKAINVNVTVGKSTEAQTVEPGPVHDPTVTAIVFIAEEDDRSRSDDENFTQSPYFGFILLGAILSTFVITLILFAVMFVLHYKRRGGSADQLPPMPCRFRPQPDPDALEMIFRSLAQPQPVGITNPPTQDGAVLPDRGVMTLSLDSDPFYFEIPERRDGRARAPHVGRPPPIPRPVSTLYPSSDEASARPVSTLYPSSDYDSEAFWCPSRVVKSWPSDDSDGHVDSTSSSNASTESSTAYAVRIKPAASDYMHPVATMVDRVAAWRSSGWRKTGARPSARPTARPTAVTQPGDDLTRPTPSCSHQDDSPTADVGSDRNSATPSEESLPIPALPQKMALRPRPPAQHPTIASDVSRNSSKEGATARQVPGGSSEEGATALACPQPEASACPVHAWKPFADDYLTSPVYSRQERLELLKRQQAEEEKNFATESLSADNTMPKKQHPAPLPRHLSLQTRATQKNEGAALKTEADDDSSSTSSSI